MRIPLLLVIRGLLCGLVLWAGAALADSTVDVEVRRDFEAVLDLWRDGRYGELYERTYVSGRQSRESFIRRVSAAGLRPACCWEKLQEVKVTATDGEKATLYARVGLESAGAATEFSTRSFRLRREDGVWKAAASDIISLAGRPSRKVRRP
ncbi:hypothetical protein EG829_05420 [bacterium]|nr:hypothetical protein [bacterium]